MTVRTPLVLGADGVPQQLQSGDSINAIADTDLTGAAWTTYPPTLAAFAGSLTSATATGRYKRIGKTVFVQIRVEITTNGSASGGVTVSLPFVPRNTGNAADRWVLAGRAENGSLGYPMLQGVISSNNNQAFIVTYNSSYPGGDGVTLNASGSYEAA